MAEESKLQLHQMRMLEEYKRVSTDHALLKSFIESNPIFGTLPTEEQTDMNAQACAMYLYAVSLHRRIERFSQ